MVDETSRSVPDGASASGPGPNDEDEAERPGDVATAGESATEPEASADIAATGGPVAAGIGPDWATIDAASQLEGARRLDVPRAYGRIFDRYLDRPLLFAALGLPGAIGAAIVNVQAGPRLSLVLFYATAIALLFVNEIAWIAIVAATNRLHAGEPTGIRAAAGAVRGRVARIIGTTIIRVLAAVALLIGLSIVGAIILAVTHKVELWTILLFGLILIGPLAVLNARWSLAGPAIVLDGSGATEALGRSWAHTARNTIRVVSLYTLVGLTVLPLTVGGSLLAVVVGQPALGFGVSLVTAAIGLPLLAITAAELDAQLTGRVAAGEPSHRRPIARLGTAAGLVGLGLVLLVVSVPRFGGAVGRDLLASVPEADRGHIFVGRLPNPANPCHPNDVRTSWGTGTPLYIGGYFTRPALSGEAATIDIDRNGRRLGSVPLPTTVVTACYYELNPVATLHQGHYRIAIVSGAEILAEGEFDVG